MKTLANGWHIVSASARNDDGIRIVLAMHPTDGRYAVWSEREDGSTVCGQYSNDITTASRLFAERRAAK